MHTALGQPEPTSSSFFPLGLKETKPCIFAVSTIPTLYLISPNLPSGEPLYPMGPSGSEMLGRACFRQVEKRVSFPLCCLQDLSHCSTCCLEQLVLLLWELGRRILESCICFWVPGKG